MIKSVGNPTRLIFYITGWQTILLCVNLFANPKQSTRWDGHGTVSINDESFHTEMHDSRQTHSLNTVGMDLFALLHNVCSSSVISVSALNFFCLVFSVQNINKMAYEL